MSETKTAPTGTEAIEAAAAALNGDPAVKPEESKEKQGDPAEDSLGEAGKKALKAEREARTAAERQAAELKARLDKIEAANMSDLERAQKEAREASEEAAKARVDVLRFRVAAQHGITEEDAELFLTGTDADTLTRQAARLKERTATAPKPDLSQGSQQPQALNSDGLTEALSRAVGARQTTT